MAQILDRLARLEELNRELRDEVRALREELSSVRGSGPLPQRTEERLAVVETRLSEQAQTKVEASQRLPLKITGTALFNVFLNSSGGTQYPTTAGAGEGRSGGATFRQSVIGLDYRGPETVWGGKIRGNLLLDFFGGSGQSLDQLVRLRIASIAVEWAQRSMLVGIDKPIIAPREPNSLAQVGVSPLTGAGNLWLWVPQVRGEQRIAFSERSGLRAQLGVVQTREAYSTTPSGHTPYGEKARPGLEGRFELHLGTERRIEIAPGFHVSTSHVDGTSVGSRLVSLDWFAGAWRGLSLTGAAFGGHNIAPLGTGGAGGGLSYPAPGKVLPVHSRGGWGQLGYQATRRLSFNLFTGMQDNRDLDLQRGQIGRNLALGTNLFYRLAPNVVLGLEASQLRTTRVASGTSLNNHYDLAVAYLF